MQRFFEIRFDGTTQQPVVEKATGAPVREDRFLNALWPQITEIHDLHFEEASGVRWTHARPLSLAERFTGLKTKKPQI